MKTHATSQTAEAEVITGRQFGVVLLISFAIVGLSLLVHFAAPSSIHLSEQVWSQRVAFHHTLLPFQVRPLTNGILDAGHDLFGFSYKTIFFTLQFFLYLVCLPAFWYYLRTLRFSHAYSLAGMLIFGLTLPLFLANFEPIHTWSDFWVYIGLPLSFAALIRRRYTVSLLAMTLALVARETTLLFVPVWFAFMYTANGRRWLIAAIIAGIPILAATVIRLLNIDTVTVIPTWDFDFNFANGLRASDALFSTFVSLGFVWVVGLRQAFQRSDISIYNYDLIRAAALFTSAGTLVSTLLLTYARETRLFVPPIIFLIPLVLVYVREHSTEIRWLLKRTSAGIAVLSGIALLALCILAAKLAFPVFEFRPWHDGNWAYLGLHLALIIVFLLVEFRKRTRPVAVQQGKN